MLEAAAERRRDRKWSRRQIQSRCRLQARRLTNPEVRCAGISINTSALDPSTADSLLTQMADAFGLPCVDPVRGGIAEIVDRL